MVISRRKRKEKKDISVYMIDKLLEQVQNIKYLRIIIDSKLNFREHFNLLRTKRNLFYVRNQFVPRSKHFPPRL